MPASGRALILNSIDTLSSREDEVAAILAVCQYIDGDKCSDGVPPDERARWRQAGWREVHLSRQRGVPLDRGWGR